MKTQDKIIALQSIMQNISGFSITLEQSETAADAIMRPLKAVLQSLKEEREEEIKKEMRKIKRKQKNEKVNGEDSSPNMVAHYPNGRPSESI